MYDAACRSVAARSTDLAIERALVGGVAAAGHATMAKQLLNRLWRSDFTEPRLIAVWRAMVTMRRGGLPIEPALLKDQLVGDPAFGDGREVGPFVSDLLAEAPPPASLGWYAGRVLELSACRQGSRSAVRLAQASCRDVEVLTKVFDEESQAVRTAIARARGAVVVGSPDREPAI